MLQAWGAGGLVFLVGAGCLFAAIVRFIPADVALDWPPVTPSQICYRPPVKRPDRHKRAQGRYE